jgi:PBP1b-binding outer membrane lipoprotein LpoB
MPAFMKTIAAVLGVALVAGCSSYSATEATFGDSVHNVIAKQQLGAGGPLAEDEPLESTDGRRMENVTRVYQTNVGNPAAVVGTKEISGGSQ